MDAFINNILRTLTAMPNVVHDDQPMDTDDHVVQPASHSSHGDEAEGEEEEEVEEPPKKKTKPDSTAKKTAVAPVKEKKGRKT